MAIGQVNPFKIGRISFDGGLNCSRGDIDTIRGGSHCD